MATIKKNTNYIIVQQYDDDSNLSAPKLLAKNYYQSNYTDGSHGYFAAHVRNEGFYKILHQAENIKDIVEHLPVCKEEIHLNVPELYKELLEKGKYALVHDLKNDERIMRYDKQVADKLKEYIDDPDSLLNRTLKRAIALFDAEMTSEIADYIKERQKEDPSYNVGRLVVEVLAFAFASKEMQWCLEDAVDKFNFKHYENRFDIDFADGIDVDEKGNPNIMVIPNERMERYIVDQTEYKDRDDVEVYDMCVVHNLEMGKFELGYLKLWHRDEDGNYDDPFYPEKDVYIEFNDVEYKSFAEAIDEMSRDDFVIEDDLDK